VDSFDITQIPGKINSSVFLMKKGIETILTSTYCNNINK